MCAFRIYPSLEAFAQVVSIGVQSEVFLCIGGIRLENELAHFQNSTMRDATG